MNGKETDIDCGGGTCPKCVDARMCKVKTDCVSGVCTGGKCAAPTCADKVMNGKETDIDCGGGTCPKCSDARQCKTTGDCLGNWCVSGKCRSFGSCAAIRAYSSSYGTGTYWIRPSGYSAFTAYCNMSSYGGGWTLVARVRSNSTGHSTASAIGTVSSPSQGSTAKYADALINKIKTNRAWMNIPGAANIFVNVSGINIDLRAGASYSYANRASYSSPTSGFNQPIASFPVCYLDCGVFVTGQYSASHNFCGYQYYQTTSVRRPGMGCKYAGGKDGTLWVR